VTNPPNPAAGSTVDRDRLAALLASERERFARAHPRSAGLHERAKGSLLDGVPMTWMSEWASPFPLFVERAAGAAFRCVDGHDYVDFCLGDTGAMTGHAPAAATAAIRDQLERASLSIVLNLAEGAAKPTVKDKRKFYSTAYGSIREVQAILRILNNAQLFKHADYLGGCAYKLIRNT
jgi:four helix bundle protein